MIDSERTALANTCTAIDLGPAGSIVSATLIAAPDDVLAELAQSAPTSTMEDIFAFLTGGRMSVGGYCAVWEGRYNLLVGLEHMQNRAPYLLRALSPVQIVGVATNEFDVLCDIAAEAEDIAVLAAQVYDLDVLRADLDLVAGLWISPRDVLLQTGPIPHDEQAAILGLFLRDMQATTEWHVLGVAFMAPVWRLLFLILNQENMIAAELAESALEAVNELVPTGA